MQCNQIKSINQYLAQMISCKSEQDFIKSTKEIYSRLNCIQYEVHYQLLCNLLMDIDYQEYKAERLRLNPNLEMQ